MPVYPRILEAENQCEMFVPAEPLLEVIVETVCCSEVKTPSEDSTLYSTATATNKMMNATTETTKLNFITDHGSSRDRVSCACRLGRLEALGFRLGLVARFCQAFVTELV
jgi:hypothetical protein